MVAWTSIAMEVRELVRCGVYFDGLEWGMRERDKPQITRVYGLSNWRDRSAINGNGEDCGWSRFLEEN